MVKDRGSWVKRNLGALAIGFLLVTHHSRLTTAFGAVEMPAASYIKGLKWLGHASFRLERGGMVVYWDPWQLSTEPHDADLILISHPHFDHLSAADVAKVVKPSQEGSKPDTVIVTVSDCMAQLEKAGFGGLVQVVKPGDKLAVKAATVEAVPAYNTDKTFHLQSNRWAGYILELDGTRIYHAGDTDFIPEMKELKVDAALLPVSGTYVMTAEQAAQAAKAIGAKVSVPMHYGSIVGTEADARRFRELSGGLVVEVFLKEQ